MPRPTAKVRVPAAEADQPKLLQVGVIALVCFAIGMVWPTIWGASLVPAVPSQEGEEKPKAKPKPERSPGADDPGKEVPVTAVAPHDAVRSDVARAEVQKALVVNCRDDQERRLDQCDTPGLAQVAEPRLQALTACPAVQGKAGTLSISFELDFSKEKITKFSSGKSSTLDAATVDGLLECAKREFLSASLRGVAHTHARYLLFYTVQFIPAGVAVAPAVGAEATPEAVVPASGSATVVWNSARVRSEPDGGEVRERLLYGTRVLVTGRQGDWYRVRYDAKGNEGWVHKNALAM